MSDDPLLRIAKLRIIKLSAELEVDLATRRGGNIAIEIVNRLRHRAAESMVALATCTLKVEDIVTHQNEVKRYDEWFCCLRDIIQEGKQHDQQLTEQDREETLELLSQSQEGIAQAIELGLIEDERRE